MKEEDNLSFQVAHVQISPKIATFLDLELNLKNGVHRPYRKPDNEPLYVNANSNHSPNLYKEDPQRNN